MKKTAFVLAVLLLLGCCACGRIPEVTPPSVEITTLPPAPQTDGAPVFQLDALPDIGPYQPKKAECFFDAPLQEFRESASYGGIVPYVKTSNGQVPSYGFITTDGRIITDDIYSEVELFENEHGAVYCARLKSHFLPENSDVDSQAQWNNYPEYVHYQLIRTDGSAFVSLDRMTPSLWPADSPYIVCHVWAHDGGYVDDTFLVYDFDLRLAADLTEYQIPYGRLADRGNGRFSVYEDKKVYFFDNGRLTDTVMLTDTNPDVYGDYILADGNVYAADGTRLMELPTSAETAYDASLKRLYIADVDGMRLLMAENGEIRKEVDIAENCKRLTVCRSDGETRLVAEFQNEDSRNLYQVGIFNAELEPVAAFSLKDTGDPGRIEILENGNHMLIVIVENGSTTLYDLSGRQVDRLEGNVSFSYTAGGYVGFGDASEMLYAYISASDTLIRLPEGLRMSEHTFCAYMDEEIMVWNYRDPYALPEEIRFEFEPRLTDVIRITTGETLYEGLSDCTVTKLGDQRYLSFAAGGMAYVFDKEMRQIAAIPDDYYA